MKTVLVIAAVLGLSSTAALAECAGHNVTASAKVDKEVTTASIAPPKVDPRQEAAVLKQSEGQAKVTE
ncbi:hypothetical protein [Neorhizobium sp. T6_25]|uniref:hypothetical protein n=1 Tax=Neorhizobium sp. T6_25 TaxID=2093833 RepID=UPI000CF8A9AA|nr:hypothetical protein [Neorhizobium sp. T6_25]